MNIRDLALSLDEYTFKECLSTDAFIVSFNPYNKIFPLRTTFRSDDLDMLKLVSGLGLQVFTPQLKGTNKKELVL